LPVFNGERYIETAVRSILDQTLRDFELIIINDGSTDNTLELIKGYSYKDNRIKVLMNQENRGLVYSLNYGLANARGRYIARMDADDFSHPLRLAKQVAYLDSHPEIGLLGSAVCKINEKGQCIATYNLPGDDILIRWNSLFDCAFCHPSVMFRREFYEITGGYDPKMENAEDYALWSKMLTLTKTANLPDPLVNHRKSDTQVSRVKRTEQLFITALISAENINFLMKLNNFVSIEEAAILRSWYFPSSESIFLPDSEMIIHKLIEIYYQFKEKYQEDPGVSNYVVFIILNVLKRAPLPIYKKIKFIFLTAKINLFQSIKTMFGFIIRGSDKLISDKLG
jgi:glycosyltransferase involved in cell wall biosynthesis